MLRLRKTLAALACFAMLAAFFIPQAGAAQFADVQSTHSFYEHVEFLGSHHVVNGLNGYFYPDKVVSRGEITKIVLNAAGTVLDGSATRAFEDVGIGNDFFAYVNTAYKNGVISGYGNGLFGPDDMVKRGEALKILVSAFGFTTNTTGGPHFVDVTAGSDFYNYIETAYNLGIVSGRGASFWPGNYMTRGEMAKIVAMAMQGGDSATEYVLNASANIYPQANISLANSTDDKLNFEFTRMPELQNGYKYEAWLLDDAGVMTSIGTFNVDENGSMLNEGGRRISNVLDTNLEVLDYDMVKVTIEANNDSSADPSDTLILEGDLNDEGSAILGFPRLGSGLGGSVFVSGTDKDSVNFDLRGLSDVADIGMRYSALMYTDGAYKSLGTFQAGEGSTSFKASASTDLTKVGKFVVGLEPYPDDNNGPFITVMSVTVDSSSLSADEEDEDWGTCDFDESIYDGLTSELTSESIICRTVEERDETEDVIVQAYASAESVPASSEVAIVIKVSDLEGNPIKDLNLDLSQMSGLEGTLGDPRERGNSGVYVGTYSAPDSSEFSLTSNDVVLRISQNNNSTADQYVPQIDLTLSLKSSTRRGTPKIMEIDVPQEEITYDANESGQTDELVVIATLLDSAHATVETSSSTYGNDIKLNGSSSNNDNETPDLKEGNLYLYEVDMGSLYNNNDDYEVTVSENFQIEFYDRSSTGAYLPIISDQYEVNLHFIPRD
ncbi:MAG: S-layer homology domain-containing protein [Candidatus Gracilibacteria bacterium]|nr:S-layer homology domain-containing protein [Candidatus Gracilibacteria bacterium]